MAKVTARASERISSGLKRFQPIIESAKARDLNESDTVVIVTDLLSEVFGYEKYTEITSEHLIRGTFCDLAIKLDGKLSLLIEVKAIGTDLKDNHIKQAVDYAANQGCEWVILTNGQLWQAYRVRFEKPIAHDLVLDIDLLKVSHRRDEDVESLWLVSREGLQKSGLDDYHAQREALSRFVIAAVVQGDAVVDVIRRELRRISPDVKIANEEILSVLTADVLKRDVIEGEKAQGARKMAARAQRKREKQAEASSEPGPIMPPSGT